MSNGSLQNTQDTNYRPIDDDYPVFGCSIDLGAVNDPVSTVYALGLTQEEAVQFDGETGVVPVTSLWTSYFSSELDAVSALPHHQKAITKMIDICRCHSSIMISAQPVASQTLSTNRSHKTQLPQEDRITSQLLLSAHDKLLGQSN